MTIPWLLNKCPGFSQDRVNFYRNPGRESRKGHSWAGWHNLAKQSRVCHTMCRHTGFWWVGGAAGTISRLGSWLWQSWRAALRVVQFVLGFLLIYIIVVPVPFVCCSVKLPLSRHTGFLRISFHSLPHHGRGRGGRVALLLAAAVKTRTHWKCLISGWTRL